MLVESSIGQRLSWFKDLLVLNISHKISQYLVPSLPFSVLINADNFSDVSFYTGNSNLKLQNSHYFINAFAKSNGSNKNKRLKIR